MDPNTNLRDQLVWARFILDNKDECQSIAIELANLVVALDEWITLGGFLPEAWRENQPDNGWRACALAEAQKVVGKQKLIEHLEAKLAGGTE